MPVRICCADNLYIARKRKGRLIKPFTFHFLLLSLTDPFVPVLKGGGEKSVVRQAVKLLRADEQLNELEPLLAFFARFVLSTALVQQIMR